MTEKPLESYFSKIVSEVKGFAFFMIDPAGVILTWNLGCELLKGYKSEEAIGKNYNILFPDFLRDEKMPEKELQIANDKGRFETENWRRKKNGDLFWASLVLTKITDDSGKLVGYAKIAQDQSDKKKYLDQLNSKIEEFERINTDLNDFVYATSHDLKAPINNIEGLLIMLKMELETKENFSNDTLRLLELIQESAGKFKSIITDLASTAKNDSTINTYQSFKDVSDEIKSLLVNDIQSSDAVFYEDYSRIKLIRYPRKHLRSIFLNLITNALKYRCPDRRPEISIKTSKVDAYTLLEVSDNGLGIKEEDQKDIFALYHRLEQGKNEEGTGVGLGLVSKIVDDHFGKIEIESKLNEGTTFKIYLR